MTAQTIPIKQIVKGRNPRTRFDQGKLEELALSIQERGLIHPIVVEPYKQGTYVLVAGERRLRAYELLKRTRIKAIVQDCSNHNGRERLLDSIIENVQREDMDPIDEANAYLALKQEFDMSEADIARKTGKAAVIINNCLLLTKLEPEIQEMIRQGFWKDPRLARGLLQLPDKKVRLALAKKLHDGRISLNGCLSAVTSTLATLQAPPVKRGPKPKNPEPYFARNSSLGADQVPAVEFAGAQERPLRWDALRQLGQVPEWLLVVRAAESTCRSCPLRDSASPLNCEGCAAVSLQQRLMEVAK